MLKIDDIFSQSRANGFPDKGKSYLDGEASIKSFQILNLSNTVWVEGQCCENSKKWKIR